MIRRAATAVTIGLLASGVVAACSGKTTQAGGLEVLLRTNMSMPQDFDTIETVVSQRSPTGGWQPILDYPYTVTSQSSLPQTVSIAAGPTPSADVLIDVKAKKGSDTIVFREVQTQTPTDRVAELEIFLAQVCARVTCPIMESCDPAIGKCGSNVVSVTTLPNYDPGRDGGLVTPVPADAHDSSIEATTPDAGDDGTDGSTPEAGDGCPPGNISCGGTCVPSDVHNCGVCGHDCTSLPNVIGTVGCNAGACTFDASACKFGYAHCSTNADQGCEVDISTVSDCGACGSACSATLPHCAGTGSAYSCVNNCPVATPTLCNGTTCVNIMGDPNNCGMCGHACTTTVTHAVTTCSGATCGAACSNASYPNSCTGACVNFTNDANNCGSCGHKCLTGTCSASKCQSWTVGTLSDTSCPDLASDGTYVVWNDGANVKEAGIAGGTAITLGGVPSGATNPCSVAMANGVVVWDSWFQPGSSDVYSFVMQAVAGTANSAKQGAQGDSQGAPWSGPGNIAINSTGGTAFYADRYTGSVDTCALTGVTGHCGSTTGVSISEQMWGDDVASGAGMLFYTSAASGEVYEMTIGASAPTKVASGEAGPYALAFDGTYIYWASQGLGASTFTVGRNPKTSPNPAAPTAVLKATTGGGRIATDGKYLYFGATNASGAGYLGYVPVAGGTAQTLYTGANGSRVDPHAAVGGAVYFIDTGTKTVRGIAAP